MQGCETSVLLRVFALPHTNMLLLAHKDLQYNFVEGNFTGQNLKQRVASYTQGMPLQQCCRPGQLLVLSFNHCMPKKWR